jgi:hypothetical protein
MFSDKLERRRRIERFAAVVAATVLLAGLGGIAIVAMEAMDMAKAMDAGPAPVVVGTGIALAGVLVLSFLAYAAVRVYARVTSR